MTDSIKNVLPRDAATISEIQASDGFRAAAPAAKFKDHVSRDAGQLSEAWSALGWYGKDTASFAFLAAKTIQSGYGVNTLEARLRVLALLKIIRPTMTGSGNGRRMLPSPPEGSPYGNMWPHQRLGYDTWPEFVLGPAAGISGPDGSYIKGPGLGFGAGIDPSDPDAKAKQDRALAYERDLFRGYERLMALLPETALPHDPDDVRSHYRATFDTELTVEAIQALGQQEDRAKRPECTAGCTQSRRTRVLAKNPTRAAATVQRAAAATGDPAGYLRQIAEAIAPPAPTPAECIAELARRYDRQFLEELCVALADYITTTQS